MRADSGQVGLAQRLRTTPVGTWTHEALLAISRGLPCRVIPAERGPYLSRYTVRELPGRAGWVYLHFFHTGDQGDDLHSHPWDGEALILLGGYVEERRVSPHATYPGGGGVITKRAFRPGDTNRFAATTFHRIDLLDRRGCWTLFETGPYQKRGWGFWNRHTGGYRRAQEALRDRGLA